MRYTDNPDIDAEIEQLVRKNLFRIDRFIASMGYAPLSKDELRSIYQFASTKARQAAQQAKTQQANPNLATQGGGAHPLIQGPQAPPVPSFAVEGGLVNDRSGQGSTLLKRRGYQVGP